TPKSGRRFSGVIMRPRSDLILIVLAHGLRVVRFLRSDPVDVRAGDADVGQLTIGEVRKLALHGRVPLPGLIEAGEGCKHVFKSFSPAGCPVAPESTRDMGASVHRTIDCAAVQPETRRMPTACLGEAFLPDWAAPRTGEESGSLSSAR